MAKTRGVFERETGSGVWWIRYADQYGKIHKEKVGPRSLAKLAYAKRKTEVREGRFFPPKRKRDMAFEDFFQLYLRDYAKPEKESWRDDLSRSKRLIKAFGGKGLSEITPQDVEQFKAKLNGELSDASINRHLALLKTVFNKAIQWGKLDKSPAKEIKLKKENDHRIRYLTEDEEKRLKAIMKPEHWRLVEFALNTGLRRSEMFNLQWPDVEVERGRIRIINTKSGKPRYVSLNSIAMGILRGLESRLRDSRSSPWVFLSSNEETPIIGSNFVKRTFRPALKEAGIEGFTWHDLRHSFASRLVKKGVDLVSVKELMGHSKIDMTLRYSHVDPDHLAQAVETLVKPKSKAPGRSKRKKASEDRPGKETRKDRL